MPLNETQERYRRHQRTTASYNVAVLMGGARQGRAWGQAKVRYAACPGPATRAQGWRCQSNFWRVQLDFTAARNGPVRLECDEHLPYVGRYGLKAPRPAPC
jgi:hypothetical protein